MKEENIRKDLEKNRKKGRKNNEKDVCNDRRKKVWKEDIKEV